MAKAQNNTEKTTAIDPTAAEKLANPLGGLTVEEAAAIAHQQNVILAEQKIKDEAPSESKRRFILQEVRIDNYTLLRRRVELTPSMCTHRGCAFDAAKEVGFKSGWNSVPHDQQLPQGRTLGQAILGVLENHQAFAHALDQSHIITEDELKRQKGWAGVPGQFLTNPKLAGA